jgi:hypothetical protein
MKKICPLCGTENEENAKFCKECNEPLYNTEEERGREESAEERISDNNKEYSEPPYGNDTNNTSNNIDRKKQIEEEEEIRAEARVKAEEGLKEKKKKEENKKVGQGCLVFLGIILVIIVLVNLGGGNDEKPVLTEAEQRREMIEKQFSAWDGSHRELTKFIKESMHDPKSYEHIKTTYVDRGDHLIVETTFRGKNVYGGVVSNTIRVKALISGEVVEILSQN